MSVKLGESTHSTVQINNLCEKSTLYSYVEVDCTKYLKGTCNDYNYLV